MRPDGVTSLNMKARRKVYEQIKTSPPEGNVSLKRRKPRAESLSDGKEDENLMMRREKVTEKRFSGARNTLCSRVLA